MGFEPTTTGITIQDSRPAVADQQHRGRERDQAGAGRRAAVQAGGQARLGRWRLVHQFKLDTGEAEARRNLRDYRQQGRVRLVRSDLFDALGDVRYDLIVANPPYVDARSMRALPREYRNEPRLALAGGRNGLAFVHRILAGARRHLSERGALVVEIGGNRRALERALPLTPFTWLETAAGGSQVFLLERDQLPADG